MQDSLKSRSDLSVILFFFIGLTILGVLGAGFVVGDYARARASAAWPVYDGVVLSRRGRVDDLRYVYSVEGRSYESRRVRFFTASFSPNPIRGLRAGESVPVYVDPADHRFSVLTPGGASAVFVLASMFTGACVFFGVGGIVRTLMIAAQGAGGEESPATL